jgi:release factor glutamine methyltransferase
VNHTWTVRDGIRWATEQLQREHIEAARFEAELLLAHTLATGRLEIHGSPERVLAPAESERLEELVQRRCAGEPLQYLIGYVDFYNCRLKVAPSVLIPRPETEELVERIIADYARAPSQIVDLGTGSGAIAIALARVWPASSFVAVDLSPEALFVARENAVQNGVAERIRFACSDWFSGVSGSFDLIVANPPYVSTDDLKHAQRELQHESRLALDGGERGLDAINQIIQESPCYLRSHGRLYLEIGSGQGACVRELFRESRAFEHVEILKDLSGQERFARAVQGTVEQQCLS